MSEELNEVAEQVAPAVAPVAEVPAQEPEQLPPPPEEVVIPDEPAAEALPPDPDLSEEGIAKTVAAEQAAAKAAPKFQPKKLKKVQQTPQKSARRSPPTDAEVVAKWKQSLAGAKLYSDEAFVEALCAYATKHKGFNPNRRHGGVLISMFIRFAEKLTALPEFQINEGEYISRKIQEFLMNMSDIIGDGPADWSARFSSNYEQRRAIDASLGIDKPMHKIQPRDLAIVALRQAAWPTKKEEELGIGGTFAERFVYFVMAVLAMLMDETLSQAMFKDIVHDKTITKPDWIDENGKCKECGSDVTLKGDTYVCTNLVCANRIPVVATDGFTGKPQQQNRGPRAPRRDFTPSYTPDFPSGGQKRDGRDHRHERGDDDEMPKFKKHGKGKKFRPREEDGDIEQTVQTPSEPAPIMSTPGSENFGNIGSLLDGLKIQ